MNEKIYLTFESIDADGWAVYRTWAGETVALKALAGGGFEALRPGGDWEVTGSFNVEGTKDIVVDLVRKPVAP